MSSKAIYPGSFDPMTYGHMDIIRRASEIFDVLIVSVLNNKEKTPLFSVEERVKILEEATKDLPNVQIDSFSGLLVDYAREKDLHVIGPAYAAIGKVKDIYRQVIYLKHKEYKTLVRIKDQMEKYIEINSGFRKIYIQFDFS